MYNIQMEAPGNELLIESIPSCRGFIRGVKVTNVAPFYVTRDAKSLYLFLFFRHLKLPRKELEPSFCASKKLVRVIIKDGHHILLLRDLIFPKNQGNIHSKTAKLSSLCS